MTWILVALGLIIGIGLAVALIGSVLPRDHTARATIELTAPRDRVWRLVSDFAGTPQWRPDLRSVQLDSSADGGVRFVETTKQGQTPFELVSRTAPERQVVRVVDDGLPFGGTWTWELAPAGSGTRVTLTEEGFIRNPVFRAFSRLFFKPADTIDSYLRALAAALGESGEPVVTQRR